MRAKELTERKQKLHALAEKKPDAVPCLFLVEHFNEGDVLLKFCKTYGLEGVVAKRRDRAYTSGPCRDWVKVKCPEWKEANTERWRMFEEDGKSGARRGVREPH